MLNIKFRFSHLLPIIALACSVAFVSCDGSADETENAMAEAEREMIDSKEDVKEAANKATEEMESTRTVYTIADVDTQPLFGLECPAQDDPVKCSNDEMLKFIKNNAEFPKEARNKNQDGFEQVIVVIEKDGSISDMKYAASSKTKNCDGCQKAAVDVVGKMKGWTPGMKDGKPVAVQMTIPVRFES